MRRIQHLNFDWYFADYDKKYLNTNEGMELINIPHNIQELPLNNFDEREYQRITIYKKNIELESDKKALLHFEGVMTYAEVFINGELVTSHKGGYTPFSVDVTKYGPIFELLVIVDSNEREDIPPFGYVIDYLTYGGIYREVYIEYVEDTYIENAFITTKIDGSFNIKLFVNNPVGEESIVVSFTRGESTTYNYSEEGSGLELKGVLELEGVLKNPVLWNIDAPELYDVEIKMGKDIYTTRVGFREVELNEKGFFLNGKHIKLVGLNRHQSFPYVGYAMPRRAQVKDAHILKEELGCNVVRSSHYPPSKHFLDACDEIGLLVFNEIPGWQHIGDDEWKKVAVKNVEEMIFRDYNHPSIFIWGVRINESADDEMFYTETNKVARGLDQSRPTGGVRFIQKSQLLEDVYTTNDFTHRGNNSGITKPSVISGVKAPHLVTEYNGHMFPTKKYDNELHRIEHVHRHLKVQDDSFKYNENAGAIGWCMFDYNTHKDFGAGDKICYHGVMDIFRIKKPAADVYAAFGKEPVLTICSSLNQGEYPASEVPQTTILTNCDYVKFYKNDLFIGDFYPDTKTYPHIPFPPVMITDLIGPHLEKNERFSKENSKRIKNALNEAVKHGQPNIPLKNKLGLLWVKLTERLTNEELYHLQGTYIGNWGKESVSFKFEGVKDGEIVKTVEKAPLFKPSMKVEVDDVELEIGNTYDTTRVIVSSVDECDNVTDYSFDNISLGIMNGEVIGPKEISLIGGSVGFWVKTIKPGTMRISVNGYHLGKQEVDVIVK